MISSERLDLVVLGLDGFRAVAAGRLDAVSELLGAAAPAELADAVPAALRVEQLERDPLEAPWLARALVLRDEERIVGAAGFHGPPDACGRAEIGYQVFAPDRRRGFAREAVVALLDWAARQGGVRVFVASISPENAASQRLVTSLGFERVGAQIDPVDGLEWVYERPA